MTKHKRRIMRSFKIDEISAVDTPAQEGARMALMKRREDPAEDVVISFKDFKKLAKGGRAILLTEVDDHAHLVFLEDFEGGDVRAGTTTWQDEHSHPFIIDLEGNLIVGAEAGHTHEFAAISKTFFKDASEKDIQKIYNDHIVAKQLFRCERALKADDLLPDPGLIKDPGKTADAIGKTQDPKEDNMDPETKKAAELESAVEDLTTKLAKATALGELNDAQKSFYADLDETGQAAFLEKSADDRTAQIEAATVEDPVVYKADNGTSYIKSDDPRLVDMAKQGDLDRRALAKSEKIRKEADLRKRAETEFKTLPGSVETRMALIKAADGIEDETQRGEALKALKAQTARLGKAFRTVGTGEGNEPEIFDKSSIDTRLEKMAAEYAKEHDIEYHAAYAAVLDTDEGRELYAQYTGDANLG